MFREHELAQWYSEKISIYEELTKEVLRIAEEILRMSNIEVATIMGRTKSLESFTKKVLDKKVTNPLEITDLSGIRIIGHLNRDLRKIVDALKTNGLFDIKNVDDKIQQLGEDKIGYRSVHIVGSLRSRNDQLSGHMFEIQVRSILGDAWAQLSHDKNYKLRDIMPSNLKRMFNLLSGSIENIETSFTEIFDQVEEYVKNYESQFRSFLTEKLSFVHMLSIMKLCSEIQIPRTSKNISTIQKKIFETDFKPEQLEKWLKEESGEWDFVNETAKSSVILPKEILTKILDFVVTEDFLSIVKKYNLSSSFGKFYAKSLKDHEQYLHKDPPLKNNIYKLIEKDNNFRLGFAIGIREELLSLEEKNQEFILRLSNQYPDFASQLAWGLGSLVEQLPEGIQEKVWLLAESNKEAAFPIVYNFLLRLKFNEIGLALRRKTFEISKKDIKLLNWISFFLGIYFHSLEEKMQDEIITIAVNNKEFSNGVFMHLLNGGRLFTLREALQEKLWKMALTNEDIAFFLGRGLVSGYNFFDYDSNKRRKIIEFVGRSNPFARGLGYGLSKWMPSFKDNQKKQTLKLVERNDDFADGFFFDLAYNRMSYLREYYEKYKNKTGKIIKRKLKDIHGNTQEESID